MSKFCKSCGSKLNEESKFCSCCGANNSGQNVNMNDNQNMNINNGQNVYNNQNMYTGYMENQNFNNNENSKFNTNAIIAFICSIVGLGCFGVILGAMAISLRINRTKTHKNI